MDAIGLPREAQWWYKEGRSVAQIDTQCSKQCAFFYGATNGRPLCIHSATTAMRVPSSCLLLSNLWATDLFGDLCVAVLNMLKTSRRPWRPRWCLNCPVYHPWTTKATVRPPFCLQRRPGQFCGRTREAQRSHPLCKWGITLRDGIHRYWLSQTTIIRAQH